MILFLALTDGAAEAECALLLRGITMPGLSQEGPWLAGSPALRSCSPLLCLSGVPQFS